MLDKGMIFASDSRTNAGVDNFAKFCKMTVFERRGDRVIVLLSSGNLAGTQAVISVLTQRCADGDAAANLMGARTMFDVVRLVSDAMRDIEHRDGQMPRAKGVDALASALQAIPGAGHGRLRSDPGRRRELAAPELRHRRHARVEDRIRAAKDTGLRNLPFHDAAANQVWLEIAMLAVAKRPHRIPSALIISITVAVVAARGIRDLHVRHTFVPGRPEPTDLPS